MLTQTICLASPEYAAKLVNITTEKELNFELDFQLPATASFNEVSTKLDQFLRSTTVRKTLETLKGYLIHIKVLHPVDLHVRLQSGLTETRRTWK